MINFHSYERIARTFYNNNFDPELNNTHVSIILHKRSIISIASNNYKKTHPFTQKNKYRSIYIHSEIAAFAAMDRSFIINNCSLSLINFRFLRDSNVALSKPCEFCSTWITQYFKHIYYSNDNGNYVNFIKEINHV